RLNRTCARSLSLLRRGRTRTPKLTSERSVLLNEVHTCDKPDPDHVDEVPVVGHNDRADGLLVSEPSGHERTTEDQQERDEPAGHVETVEAGREVEHRAVRR